MRICKVANLMNGLCTSEPADEARLLQVAYVTQQGSVADDSASATRVQMKVLVDPFTVTTIMQYC